MHELKQWGLGVLTAVALLGVSGCGESQPDAGVNPDWPTIEGEAYYRERMLLRPGTTMTVTLEDVSKQDVAATAVAKTAMEVQGAPPFVFALQYDPALIDPRMRYSLKVRVEEEGQLRFISDRHEDPFEGDNRILLIGAGGQPR
ncbi:YbaY family lipoprotein [Ferrimonas gelatinilytica]|uniref:Lipoprotein n=1 Tax=Ferrimonas gelatinilytica TaxID=1255257 RepID=A0ABP9S9P2_9GAMM